MIKKITFFSWILMTSAVSAQTVFPVNGVTDHRDVLYAFTHVNLVQNADRLFRDATLVIQNGKIKSVNGNVPKDAYVVDLQGKYIYPSFIDMYSDYGLDKVDGSVRGSNYSFVQFDSDAKGTMGWNQAIRSQYKAAENWKIDLKKAKSLREIGFGAVNTHLKDGIARGTAVFLALGNENKNLLTLKSVSSAHYSFSKGTSSQAYPSSLMGSIALLRQTFLDAKWYQNSAYDEGENLSLKAWNEIQVLPQIFEAKDKWMDVRADKLGDEFGVQYIIYGGGNEYQRIAEIKHTNATYILPLNFPKTMDLSDPQDARFVSLEDLRFWERAASNPAVLEKEGVKFCFTIADLANEKEFLSNIRKAIRMGLSEKTALKALTSIPASILQMDQHIGTLEVGKWANFLITDGPIFDENTTFLENWVQGEKYLLNSSGKNEIKGMYSVQITSPNAKSYEITFDGKKAMTKGLDSLKVQLKIVDDWLKIQMYSDKLPQDSYYLSGQRNGDSWQGTGIDANGQVVLWKAVKKIVASEDDSKSKQNERENIALVSKLSYPDKAYGWLHKPMQQTVLIRNVTVWTSEAIAVLAHTDVLLKDGKIAKVGKNLSASGAQIIDGSGKFLTAGIIDEHSHIAAASINEGAQSVTSEVRIGDNLNPDDINIYRQLSGGVTTAQILHGSANTIGGQSQLIKLRWGSNDEELKFVAAAPFIKFALGENVKRNPAARNNRYPNTRMGVEQVQDDAFARAKDYAALKKSGKAYRKDLELETLAEIMEGERFITCHSYVQSEILETMRIAEKYGFKINTFTHILEGYKVADAMKKHGVNASTFSDWWAYKLEVQDAIAYNAAIMTKVGVNTAINSDDAEMGRRLNQEAAKTMKYGGLTEAQAWNLVTINPAKMLHIDKQVGSIKEGKDADVVLWDDNPLSQYAKVLYTWVDGINYFDRNNQAELSKQIKEERHALIQKMKGDVAKGVAAVPAKPSYHEVMSCGDHHHHGILELVENETIEK